MIPRPSHELTNFAYKQVILSVLTEAESSNVFVDRMLELALVETVKSM